LLQRHEKERARERERECYRHVQKKSFFNVLWMNLKGISLEIEHLDIYLNDDLKKKKKFILKEQD
jgi:hypothetical protein